MGSIFIICISLLSITSLLQRYLLNIIFCFFLLFIFYILLWDYKFNYFVFSNSIKFNNPINFIHNGASDCFYREVFFFVRKTNFNKMFHIPLTKEAFLYNT